MNNYSLLKVMMLVKYINMNLKCLDIYAFKNSKPLVIKNPKLLNLTLQLKFNKFSTFNI